MKQFTRVSIFFTVTLAAPLALSSTQDETVALPALSSEAFKKLHIPTAAEKRLKQAQEVINLRIFHVKMEKLKALNRKIELLQKIQKNAPEAQKEKLKKQIQNTQEEISTLLTDIDEPSPESPSSHQVKPWTDIDLPHFKNPKALFVN